MNVRCMVNRLNCIQGPNIKSRSRAGQQEERMILGIGALGLHVDTG